MKVGLYFGSFNPVHIGHLIIANYIANHTELEQVWFVVSPQNPLKRETTLLNEHHRKHLIDLSIEGERKLKTSNVEFKLPKPSYTIDTLTYLDEKYPLHQFSIIMGSDSFQNLHKWHNYEYIVKNYPIFVYRRMGFEVENHTRSQLNLVDAPLLQISATQVRQLIKAGKSIRYLVPDKVRDEIEKYNYYK